MYPKYEDVVKLANSHPMFKVAKHPSLPLTLYSYAFADPTVFSNPIAREMRGIVFDKNGELIARPFHKFFNYGESLCSVTEKEVADSTLKIDGSLLIAFRYRGSVVFASKGSFRSWVVERAYEIASDSVYDLVKGEKGTVLFELVDPLHPIVICYDKPEIRLIGIRKPTGEYIPPSEICEIAESYGLPSTKIVHREKTVGEILKDVRGWEGEEGVVAYAESDLCKVKSRWYLDMHKIASWVVADRPDVVEKRVKALLILNELDDIYPQLPEPHKKIVDELVEKAIKEMQEFKRAVTETYEIVKEMDRKGAAQTMLQMVDEGKISKAVMSCVFRVLNTGGERIGEAVTEHFRKVWGRWK